MRIRATLFAISILLFIAADRLPVQLADPAKPADVDGRMFDVVVVEGTPAGIACAVRAAREGARVLLVNRTRHLGGMVVNGLMQWDAVYAGHRAPLFDELIRNIEGHYRAADGEASHNFRTARLSQDHYPLGMFEPHVAEREFNRLVAGEERITLLPGHYPVALERDGALLRSVTLREFGGTSDIHVRAATFVDASYEGDLLALAKVPYRVGREERDEFDEPHAGKIFTNIVKGAAPRDAVEGRLNIRPFSSQQGSIDPTSPQTGDGAVQAYNYRFCVTNDPANRLLPDKPPNYRREEYLDYNRKGIASTPGPGCKATMNTPILPGENHAYPEAGWPEREKIIRRHLEFALGLMWFLQNDESVPPAAQAGFREWGLPRDEYTDNNHVPYEMYVRESRRLVGRHFLKEQDSLIAPGLGRTPVHPDSIAVTDWYLDTHACTAETRPGYSFEGKLILNEISRPGHVPYRSLLPQGVDNLLVPVCLSATHVAWGAVRVEPTFMAIGESAGFAAALALKQGTTPGRLDSDVLIRTLANRRVMISFFNDVDVASDQPWIPAVQYFGAHGFFHDYNARVDDRLKAVTGKAWAEGLAKLRAGRLDPNGLARTVSEAERDAREMTAGEFAALLPAGAATPTNPAAAITRLEALLLMWEAIGAASE